MSTNMLVAIASDNSWAHAYPDVPAAARDARANAAHGRTAEFFDATGRLAGYDSPGAMTGF
jgi:hypothetical protein